MILVVEIIGIEDLKKKKKLLLTVGKKFQKFTNIPNPLLGIFCPIGYIIPNWGFGLLVL